MLRDRNVSEAENRKLVVSLSRKRIQCTLKSQKMVPTAWDSHMATERMEGLVVVCTGHQEVKQLGLGGSDNFRVDHRRTLNGRGTYGRERVLGGPGAQSLRGLWRCSRPAFTASTNRDAEKSTSDISGP